MLQLPFLKELLAVCRRDGVRAAVDTAGDVPFESFSQILPDVDLFLYDIKAVSPETHLRLTGVDGERMRDNYMRLQACCPDKLLARVPVVPNANLEEMPAISEFLGQATPLLVELLPYHVLGVSKARAAGLPPFITEAPSVETMARLRILFQEKGLNCL